MTDKPQEDVITKADITCKDADYVRALENRILDLERKLQFPESDSSLFVPRTWHESMLASVKTQLDTWTERFARDTQEILARLPEGMQDCTIRFKECPKGHGYLQPDNWVVLPCRQCTIDDLGARVNDLTEKLNLARAHCDILVENAQQHERRMAQALHDRLVARDELNSVRQAYSALLRQHERLREAYGVTNNLNPQEPIAADEHGPIYKDDLCPDALRDGYLRRSKESIQRRTAKPPKQEGDYGIEIITNGASECARQNCPTKQPHRHITDPNEDLDHIIAARRARMMATIADADSDTFPTKENPRHVKVPDETLDHSKPPMDANNIVGGPNEAQLAAERREVFEQAAADVLNRSFEEVPVKAFGLSDETTNTPDKKTEER